MKDREISFAKYHGTGNDFIMLNGFESNLKINEENISKMCNRHFGIGADGLIIISPSKDSDFFMQYFNSDGKRATMCGNGGRTAVLYAKHNEICKGNSILFEAVDGKHRADLLEIDEKKGKVSLEMIVPGSVSFVENNTYFINTGSPHLVVLKKDLFSMDVKNEGRKLRYSSLVPQGGANINFVEIQNDALYMRTYERGVEDETLSCGTGTVAVALVYAHLKKLQDRNSVDILSSGGLLCVEFVAEKNLFTDVKLIGPAEYVFKGKYNLS